MPLVHFVKNDAGVVAEHGVGLHLPQQQPLGKKEHARALRPAAVETDLVADAVAHLETGMSICGQ